MTLRQRLRASTRGFALALALPGFVAAVAVAQPAYSQTLSEALAQTYANNPTLLAARAQLRTVDENVPQALAGWRPTVSVSAAVGVSDSRSRALASGYDQTQQRTFFFYPPTQPSTTHIERSTLTSNVTITQPVFRGGRTVASTRRAENQVLAARARLLQTEQQILQQTIEAYVNVIRDQELLRLNINNEQVLTEQLRATSERFRVGEITRTDVAQAESRLAGARANRTQSEGNLQISRATFQRLVGVAPLRLIAPQPLRPARPHRTGSRADRGRQQPERGGGAVRRGAGARRDRHPALQPRAAAQRRGPGLPQRQPDPAALAYHRRPAHRQPHLAGLPGRRRVLGRAAGAAGRAAFPPDGGRTAPRGYAAGAPGLGAVPELARPGGQRSGPPSAPPRSPSTACNAKRSSAAAPRSRC